MSARTPTALRSRSFAADRLAWVAFLVAVALVAGLTRARLHRRVRDEGAPAGPLTAEFRLAVLAYDRVGGPDGAGIAGTRVAEHLEALRGAGFQPVSLPQVADAYRRGLPLPAHAVLVTFDGGHLSTYQAVDPVLRRLRWPAVMFLDPHLQEQRHATYVYWDRLQRMVESGLWSVGVLGAWADAAALLERRLPEQRVIGRVQASPGDAGGPGSSRLADAALVFANAPFGVNEARTDPRRLFRLRVGTGWSGSELVERLLWASSPPAATASGQGAAVPPARWTSSIGELEAEGDAMTLAGRPRAEAWLAGAEWARDFVLEAEVRPERGAFWVVQQDVETRDGWRWGGNDGASYLQHLHPGQRIEVLSRDAWRSSGAGWHLLRVIKRGGGVWVEWDGAPVRGLPRAVAPPARGYVGFSVGSPSEPGRASLRRVRFAAIPYEVRVVSASPAEAEVRSLLAAAPRLAAISPPGLVQRGKHFEPRARDDRFLAMLAARGGWDLVPTVELHDTPDPADAGPAAAVADLAARQGWAGARVVMSARGGARGGAQPWEHLFRERGLRLVLARRAEERK